MGRAIKFVVGGILVFPLLSAFRSAPVPVAGKFGGFDELVKLMTPSMGWHHPNLRLMECPVCLEEFSTLYRFECNHRLCQPCGRKLFQNGVYQCMLCRRRITKLLPPPLNECLNLARNQDLSLEPILRDDSTLRFEMFKDILLSLNQYPRDKLWYLHRLCRPLGITYNKSLLLAIMANTETLSFVPAKFEQEATLHPMFNELHHLAQRILRSQVIVPNIQYRGLDLILSTVTTTEDITMTAIQYVVHSRLVEGWSLAQIAQEFPRKCVLIAAASLEDAPPGTTDYVTEYHRVDRTVRASELARRYNIHLRPIHHEAERVFSFIKRCRRCVIQTVIEWAGREDLEYDVMELIDYILTRHGYGISLNGDCLTYTI